MKHVKNSFGAMVLLLLLTGSHCKKKTEEPQLPPVTTTGAMTFGCKINGKVFVPRDGRGKPGLICQYVNLGNDEGGGWYLNIPATNWVSSTIPSVSITTDSLLVEEGKTYEFKLDSNFLPIKGTARAVYLTGSNAYPKLNSQKGSLHVTKFDQSNRILSGTFYFTGTSASTGEKVEVTDGRFDIRY